MSRFLSVETPGGPIWVEVPDVEDTETIELVANRRDIHRTFEESAQALKQNAQYLVDLLSDLEPKPKEMTITFGISVGVEASTPIFALAKANAQASYTIALKWQPEAQQADTSTSNKD